MTQPPFKKTGAYLQNGDRPLQTLLEKAKELSLLNEHIAPYLDPNIKLYCQIGNLSNNRLTLIVANGSIATQIRFQSTDLLRKFKQDPLLKNIQSIQCKVRPDAPKRMQQPKRHIPPMQPLSPQTAQMMTDMAESLSDPALKEIMRRIAGKRIK